MTCNIFICGSAGVGKSTLVNTIFGNSVQETGSGEAITQGIWRISQEGFPFTIYDTEGFEIENKSHNSTEFLNIIRRYRYQDSIEDIINVVWICIREGSNRIEQIHIELINKCRKEKIPVMVILTQSEENNEFANIVKENIPSDVRIFFVMATPYRTKFSHIEPFGINEILHYSMLLFKDDAEGGNLSLTYKKALEIKYLTDCIDTIMRCDFEIDNCAVMIKLRDVGITSNYDGESLQSNLRKDLLHHMYPGFFDRIFKEFDEVAISKAIAYSIFQRSIDIKLEGYTNFDHFDYQHCLSVLKKGFS